MTRLPAMARELKLAGMLLHQFFEATERNNFAERRMYSFCPRLGMKNSRSFIGKLRIEPYRCHGYSHELSPRIIYIHNNKYVYTRKRRFGSKWKNVFLKCLYRE